jgi:PAS domain S-box-containing protein
MGEFVHRAVEGIPGVESCAVCLPGAVRPCLGVEPAPECADCDVIEGDIAHDPSHPCRLSGRVGIQVFPLRTQDRHFGFFLLQVAEQERYAPYEPFVGNLAAGLAVNLEREWQKDRLEAAHVELQRHREHLEGLVQERTAELDLGLERERQLNAILRAIRNVNQLITREKDRVKLLQEACQILAETRGFRSVWILGLTPDGRAEAAAESGIGAGFAGVRAQIEGGELPECCRRALASDTPIVMASPVAQCVACSVAPQYRGTAGMAVAMRHGGKGYGVLVAALPEEMADDAGERSLFHEVAGDLAFALHDLELDQQNKRAEAALRESETRYRRLFDDAQDGMALAEAKTGLIVDCNRALCRMVERDKAELVGQPQLILHPPEVDAEKVTRTFRQHREEDSGQALEDVLLSRSDKLVQVEIRAASIRMNDRDYLLGVFRDITERKQLEEQLHQAMKMEAIGRLAGGVAHDFNNALTPLMAISGILLKELSPGHPMYEDIKEMGDSGRRCADLTRQLLAFSRRQPMEMIVLNLNDAVTNMGKMLSRVIGEDIELVKFLDPDLNNTKADIGQIEQIIANLAVNSRDAMPDGGKITIETKNIYLDQDYANSHVDVCPGNHVMLAVSDTGTGIDAETRAHIFEPFFTTKEKGKGTGLGLSTVYGIVKQSGGNIWVYSEPGGGTTFKIYLPRVEEAPEEISAPKQVPAKSYRGSETILLVEDEEIVRKVAKRILSGKGYKILEAGNGEDAIKLSEKYKEPLHLIITDVIMPGISGKEMANRLLASRPGVKVLFISGYTDNAIVHHGVLEKGTNFIQKPFTEESLTAKVRKVLDND